MSRGSIWVRDCTQKSLLSEDHEDSGESSVNNNKENNDCCALTHRSETETSFVSGSVRLRRGEIGIFGCVASRLLPLVNLNERTPDINLMPGEFATIRCVNAFGQITDQVDVICDRAVRRVATRNLRVSQFVVITCDRPLPFMDTDSAEESTEVTAVDHTESTVESVEVKAEETIEDGEKELEVNIISENASSDSHRVAENGEE